MAWGSSARNEHVAGMVPGAMDEEAELREAQRAIRSGRGAAIGGMIGLGLVAVVVVLGVPRRLFRSPPPPGVAVERPFGATSGAGSSLDVVRSVMADATEVWSRAIGGHDPAQISLFDGDGTQSACSEGAGAVGTFYCAPEQKVYVDVQLLRTLDERHHEVASFAEAYLVAHAIGHHVQNMTGLHHRVAAQKASSGVVEADQLTLRQELQADCYAGVWAHHDPRTRNASPDQIAAGLSAVAQVGDEVAQQRGPGFSTPDPHTHGTPTLRAEWFRRGQATGNPADCNAFEVQRI